MQYCIFILCIIFNIDHSEFNTECNRQELVHTLERALRCWWGIQCAERKRRSKPVTIGRHTRFHTFSWAFSTITFYGQTRAEKSSTLGYKSLFFVFFDYICLPFIIFLHLETPLGALFCSLLRVCSSQHNNQQECVSTLVCCYLSLFRFKISN